jgi:ADP-heptose:LPS heptosyltransferase
MNLVLDDKRLLNLLARPDLHILTVVRDHMSGLLYAVPYLKALRQQFPQAHLTMLANPYATPILNGCPYLDQVVPFFQFRQTTGRLGRLQGLTPKVLAWLRLVGRVDLVIHFRSVGGQTLAFCALLGRPLQIGYAQNKFDYLLDLNLGTQETLVESRTSNARILEPLGLRDISPEMELWLSKEELEWARQFLNAHNWDEAEPLFILHPGCHWGCNQWLPELWSIYGNALLARFGGKIVITGAPDERPLAETIAKGLRQQPIIAAGASNLRQFAALLSQARLVTAVDTAPTQICLALKVPAVVLKGESNAVWNSPLPGEQLVFLHNWDPHREENLRCDFAAGACNGSLCRSRLGDITPGDVLQKAESLIFTST